MNIQAAELSRTTIYDEDGFLVDMDLWSRHTALQIAREEGVEHLSELHWRIIDNVRTRYLELGGLPLMRRVCKDTNLEKATIKRIFGGCRQIWRIAGLPNPGQEALAYMG